jgi:hypothetical protein
MGKSSTRPPRTSVQRVAERLRVRSDGPTREPKGFSLREAIRGLAPRLQTLRSKGYTTEGIVDLLLGHGMGSSGSTLRCYLRDFAPRLEMDLRRLRGTSLRPRAQAADRVTVVVHVERAIQ